ncbi:hypothetical protein PV327_000180 [Microctonus hyperodae]|uniref:Uncharacterized protein n=1 Tax=Microctonus hyperodae TaxID=165561 RepID=A0AA39L223_MICHY|nr:hypothetical protein PV327_000180 [Microctonus hyperodae]
MENNTSSSMTEGSAPKNKRLGTRFFKNPPQPHMCIHDYLKDSWVGCYINVLSWNKMEMGDWPPNELQLYGGKKITTPKSENPETLIFFVVMNPEVLKRNGKYSQDFKEQALLIERLLNYVEIMNNGVVFKKNYKILNDRDITGELKEIWSIVQNDKVKVQEISTFDDVMRRMPYYQNYIDNVRNQQKQLHHQQQQLQHQQKIYNHQQPAQQYCQPPPQQHQHQLQQMPTQQQQQPPPPPPPQYYYGYMNPNPGPIDKCDNHELAYTFQNQIVNNPQNDRIYQSHPVTIQNNVNFHDHMYKYQHQLQQPMGAPYEVSNSHPPANLGCPNMVNPGIPQFNRMQQPQQPQLQIAHAPPVCPYETIDTYYDPQLNFTNSIKSHSVNSSTSGNYSNLPTTAKDTSRKSISPIKVLQRDSNLGSCNKVKTLEEPARNNVMVEKKIVQVTDLDEDEGPKGQAVNDCDGTTISESVTELEKIPPQSTSESISAGTESNDSSLQQSTSVSNVFGRNRQYKKQGKTKITVLKRNNSYNDGNKSVCKDSNAKKNGATCEIEGQRNYEVNKKIIEKEILESEKLNDFISGIDKNGYGNKEQINIDECPKDTSNITRKIQKQINSSSSTITINEQSGQINGQSKNIDKENGVFNQVYTILKKPESKTTQDEVINKIVQLSMKECTDSSEISDVLS